MDQERVDILLARYLAGELSPEENEELEWLMLAHPSLRITLQVLQRMREIPKGANPAQEQEMLKRGLDRILHEPAIQPAEVVSMDIAQDDQITRKIPAHWWMAAAVLLLLALGVPLLYRENKHKQLAANLPAPPIQDKEIETRYGTRIYQELPDGSKLWLNAGSKVKYANLPGSRELTLTGEAFFDVKHDPEHPFIIHTGKLDIKVLGTSFNIKAYPNDSTIETTLINGKVEIDWPGGNQTGIVLSPREKVVIPVRDQQAVQTAIAAVDHKMVAPDPTYNTVIETSWVEDKLVFRNEAFSDVSRRLERWYNIHFSFEDKRYTQERLTGYFKDQPIRNVMDALQITLGFRYSIDGDTIRIMKP